MMINVECKAFCMEFILMPQHHKKDKNIIYPIFRKKKTQNNVQIMIERFIKHLKEITMKILFVQWR